LVLAPHHAERLSPLIQGGGQEQNRRGGTPSLPAIAGMAAALEAKYDPILISKARNDIEHFAVKLGARVIGRDAPRLPNTSCLAMPGLRADTQLIALDMAGIAVSAGAACSSGKLGPSHVLLAMGQAELAGQAIRVSLPWNVTAEAVPAFTAAYETMVNRALHRAGLPITEASIAI
jgi:cysteine desulfurase